MPDVFVSETKNVEIKPHTDSVLGKPKNIERRELHSHNPLSSYCYFPDGIKFVSKDSNERIVLFLRKHPITNIGWIIISILMFMAPMVLDQFPILTFLPDNFQFIAILGWYLIAIAFTLESFLNWFFSVYIITDERVFDVDFVNLIYREISEANIDQIQDVTAAMGGVVRTIFNYGDIFLQTASETARIEFEAVPHPDQVAKILRELRVEEEKEKLEGRVR
ncbi:MAG: hypothetical protein AAB535_04255 [Patescibacteria group bacterium]|mgnify:CR=1 FL=1